MTLLHEADELSLLEDDKGKLLCWGGFCQLASDKIDDGVQNLQKAYWLMSDNPEQRILRVTSLQILVTYFVFIEKKAIALELNNRALQEYRALGNTSLLVIPSVENRQSKVIEANKPEPNVTTTQPLRLEMICVVGKATKQFSDDETKQAMSNSVLEMSNQTEEQILPLSIGLWTFQRNVNSTLKNVLDNPKEAAKLCGTWISYHNMTLKQSGKANAGSNTKPDNNLDLTVHRERFLRSYLDQGCAFHQMKNYSEAMQSFQRALDIRLDNCLGKKIQTQHCLGKKIQTQHCLGKKIQTQLGVTFF
ncbi:uncharacterized protein LOC111332728 isoform X1 [Stylophora pistillata]|nr:uncharacterized protein LOC111332728 isoform X1 [Stylophora pistillata]XP_022793874.1 uncharacterized protein LOC111332728 isoform X1 [Stylophora pistillata]XP_022793875.1 uncharacterized protein LOC111332728 isoform X1 [Stylophora pistillata]XP_022793876.1 uncharacterized protein LOC111332728 isoform X1 [Stylophora pistillata]